VPSEGKEWFKSVATTWAAFDACAEFGNQICFAGMNVFVVESGQILG
jgi:hypothetical protein